MMNLMRMQVVGGGSSEKPGGNPGMQESARDATANSQSSTTTIDAPHAAFLQQGPLQSCSQQEQQIGNRGTQADHDFPKQTNGAAGAALDSSAMPIAIPSAGILGVGTFGTNMAQLQQVSMGDRGMANVGMPARGVQLQGDERGAGAFPFAPHPMLQVLCCRMLQCATHLAMAVLLWCRRLPELLQHCCNVSVMALPTCQHRRPRPSLAHLAPPHAVCACTYAAIVCACSLAHLDGAFA